MDENFRTLDRSQVSAEDHALALRHAPRIRFDVREPFLPSAAGYTVFRDSMASPSFPRQLELPEGAACGIEYAVWWDWDIQHLYELEHIWVYLDAAERPIAAEASWHGGMNAMVDDAGAVPLEEGRVTLFSEPGKHAFAPVRDWMLKRADITRPGCMQHAGKGGVLVTALFKDAITERTPLNNQLAWTYLERRAFEPGYEFSRIFDLAQVPHVPWPNLAAWIPSRIRWWTQLLAEQIPPHQRRVIRIAHRGASAYAQENSLAAIQQAAALGADVVEVDVRLTADGVPVIAHDDDLKRVFGVDKLIAELTAEELLAVTPAGHEPVLTLDQLVAACRSLHLGLYLDIKQINPQAGQRMLEIVRSHGMMDATIFASFRPDWVAEIKAQEPQAATSILFSSVHIDPVALAKAVNAAYVHPCWERFDAPHTFLTDAWLSAVREANLGIICWHEERPAVIEALQALGVDGICSDEPPLLLPR